MQFISIPNDSGHKRLTIENFLRKKVSGFYRDGECPGSCNWQRGLIREVITRII